RQDLPLVVAGRTAVGHVLRGRRAGPRGNVGPRGAAPLLQIEVEVDAGRPGELAGVRAGNGRLVVRAVRLDLRRAGAGERARVARARRAARRAVRRIQRDARERRVAVETDVPIPRDRVRHGHRLIVAREVRTIVVAAGRRLRAALDVEIRVAGTARHRDLELGLPRRNGDLVVRPGAGRAGDAGHGLS